MSTICKDDKSTIHEMLGAYAVIYSAKAGLDRFSEGLKTHCVPQVLSPFQSFLDPFFTHGHQEPLLLINCHTLCTELHTCSLHFYTVLKEGSVQLCSQRRVQMKQEKKRHTYCSTNIEKKSKHVQYIKNLNGNFVVFSPPARE